MNEVVDRIKAKYPEYADVPDDQLTIRIGDKYPQYLGNPSFQADYQRLSRVKVSIVGPNRHVSPFTGPGEVGYHGAMGGVVELPLFKKPESVAQGLYNTGAKVLSSFTSPFAAAVGPLSRVPGVSTVVKGVIAGLGAKTVGEAAGELSAIPSPTKGQVVEKIGDIAGGTVMTLAPLLPEPKAKLSPKTEAAVAGIKPVAEVKPEAAPVAPVVSAKSALEIDLSKRRLQTFLESKLVEPAQKEIEFLQKQGVPPDEISQIAESAGINVAEQPKPTLAPLTERAVAEVAEPIKTGEQHAETVRSNEGQIRQENVLRRSPDQGGENLQQSSPGPSNAPNAPGNEVQVQAGPRPAEGEVAPKQQLDVYALNSQGLNQQIRVAVNRSGKIVSGVGEIGYIGPESTSLFGHSLVGKTIKSVKSKYPRFTKQSYQITNPETWTLVKSPTPTGMGGAVPSEFEAGKPELAQLTDSLRTLAERSQSAAPSRAFDFGQSMAKAKDAISSAAEGLKAAGQYMKLRLIGKPVVTDYGLALGDRGLALTESVANAKKFVTNAEKAVPDKLTQEAISDYIDMGGDPVTLGVAARETKPRYRAGYEAAQKLTPEQKTIAQNLKNYFESRLQDAQDAGILEAGIEDYIHRVYEAESAWKNGVLAELKSGVFTGRPGFAKKRVFMFDYEAENAGLKPIKSFIKRIAAYDLSLNKAIADRQLIKDMMQIKMPDGRPMIDVAGIGTKIEKEGVSQATLIKPSFRVTDTDNPLNNRGDFRYYDHPSLRKWKWASTDAEGKPIFVQGDVMVHPEAIGKVKALFERSAVRKNPVGRAMLGVSSTIKQTMLDLSGFHLVQITVHGWEHRTFKPVREIDFTNPEVRGLIRGGLVAGDTRGYELFSEGLAGSSLTRYIPGIGPKLQAWNEYLFNSYIPRLKTAMALHALDRNRARFPKLTAEEQYQLTANQANAAFGELNWERMGVSRTTVDALRLTLLAPDFLTARGKFAAQALTLYGREQFVALGLGAATLYITARIINKLLDDEYHFEPKNAFSVVYNKRAYSLRTVQGDILHLVQEPGRFAYNRLNPVFGRTTMEALTGRDAFGRSRDYAEQAKDFAQSAVPISLRGLLNQREQNLLESFLNAFGVTERRSTSTSVIFQLAEKFKKENHILTDPAERIYDPDKDPYRPIQQAAFFDNPDTVAKEIRNVVKKGDVTEAQISRHFLNFANRPFTGSQANERKFIQSLTADEKKLYQEAMKERRNVVTQFQQGYRLYLRNRQGNP